VIRRVPVLWSPFTFTADGTPPMAIVPTASKLADCSAGLGFGLP
jgi:hypothetical protein